MVQPRPFHPQKPRYLSEPELIEVLAATTLTLYRATIMSARLRHGTWLQALDADLFTVCPGDLVMDVRDWHTAGRERIGFLNTILRQTPDGVVALVQKLDGHFVTWKDARLVKVYQRPFGDTQL